MMAEHAVVKKVSLIVADQKRSLISNSQVRNNKKGKTAQGFNNITSRNIMIDYM